MKKVVMDDFLSEDEDNEENKRVLTVKQLDKEEFEKNKANFDFKQIVSTFILKKDYFISHKTTDIFLDYDIDDKPIGEGSFGVVYKGVEKNTNIVRAIKQIFNENITNYDGFMTEVSALKTLDHPNVVKLFEVYQDKTCVFLVLEYLDGGELFDYIADRDHLTEADSARFFKQMMSAIIYCHKNRICHRDLKPDNFMLASKDQDAYIKLIDFGLSRSFYKFHGEGKGEIIRMETKVGTSLYMAPEVLSKNYSNACDTWSLGVILYIMLCGCPPFDGEDDQEIYAAIKNLAYDFSDEAWQSVSEDAKDLVNKILVEEKNRITPKEALNHPWVKRFNSNDKNEISKEYLEKLENFKNSTNLKKAILSFLATKSSDKDIQEEIALFNTFDKNKDGYITVNELKKGIKSMNNRSDEEIEAIMNSIDTDKNGAINYNEFIAATLNAKIASDFERIEKAFEFFDLDNDGFIDEVELKDALAGKEFEKIDISIFQEALQECDMNGDGKVDFSEFTQAMENKLNEKVKASANPTDLEQTAE